MGNEDTLISRAQAGDEGAFAELMRSHYAFVYAIVIGIVNNPNDAEEVVQDTFLNAYCGLAQYEEQTKLKSWLAKIARNRALNWSREQRMDTVSIDEVDEPTVQMSESPDECLIRDEQRELIRRAMGTLSQKDREIARAYYLEGASYNELIRTHGLSYKAISFRLSRAKQKLAKRLGHLRTGVFAFPASPLKQEYSGGLTVMKVGTVPKITAGIVAIIVLAFIGTRQFISSKEDSSPSVKVVTSTPIESANSVTQRDAVPRKDVVTLPSREDKPQISAEEWEQLEEFLTWLEELEEEDRTVEQDEGSNTSNAAHSLRSEDVPPQSEPTEKVADKVADEEVLDFLTSWPTTGIYYVRDMLLYREDINGDNPNEELRAVLESQLAKNPDAIRHYSNPRDPNSGVRVLMLDGTVLPGHVYWADPSYYDRLYGHGASREK